MRYVGPNRDGPSAGIGYAPGGGGAGNYPHLIGKLDVNDMDGLLQVHQNSESVETEVNLPPTSSNDERASFSPETDHYYVRGLTMGQVDKMEGYKSSKRSSVNPTLKGSPYYRRQHQLVEEALGTNRKHE